eukprot:3602525-Pleurochrysis_carterae.AAC.4
MEATSQERKRPNHEALQRPLTDVVSSEYIESLPIGSFAPVFARDSLQKLWLPCVLIRKAEKESEF